MKNAEIAKIVKRVQAGEQAAFEELYQQTFHVVYYYCHAHLNRNEVEDAVQEVYLKLFSRINDIKKAGAFNKMLSLFMVDICTKYYKQNHGMKEVDIDEMAEILKEDKIQFLPEELLENSDIRERLQAAVEKLPPKQKEAFLLYYFQDLSVKEICEITGRQKNAILNNLHLGRKNICDQLGVDFADASKGSKKMLAFAPFMLNFFDAEAMVMAAPFREQIWQGVASQLALSPAPSGGGSGSGANAAKTGLSSAGKVGVVASATAAVVISSVLIANQWNKPEEPPAMSSSAVYSAGSYADDHLDVALLAALPQEEAEKVLDIVEVFLDVDTVEDYDTFCLTYGFKAVNGESIGDDVVYYTHVLDLEGGIVLTVGVEDIDGAVSLAYQLSEGEMDETGMYASDWFMSNTVSD